MKREFLNVTYFYCGLMDFHIFHYLSSFLNKGISDRQFLDICKNIFYLVKFYSKIFCKSILGDIEEH